MALAKTFSIRPILQKTKKALRSELMLPDLHANTLLSGSSCSPVPGQPGEQMLTNEAVQTRLSSSLHMSHLAAVCIMRHRAL